MDSKFLLVSIKSPLTICIAGLYISSSLSRHSHAKLAKPRPIPPSTVTRPEVISHAMPADSTPRAAALLGLVVDEGAEVVALEPVEAPLSVLDRTELRRVALAPVSVSVSVVETTMELADELVASLAGTMADEVSGKRGPLAVEKKPSGTEVALEALPDVVMLVHEQLSQEDKGRAGIEDLLGGRRAEDLRCSEHPCGGQRGRDGDCDGDTHGCLGFC